MGVIKQFNYVQGANQLYVEDFANISNSANNALAGLPWTTPLSICNASFFGSGPSKVLNITPDTLVVVHGIVFGSDITVKMTSSQYLYAICEYDTSSPRQDGESEQYYQAVVRKIQVSDSELSNAGLGSAAIFPGIGNYPILWPHFSDTTGSIKVNSDGSISPFKSVIPDDAVTTEKIIDDAVTTEKIFAKAVTGSKISDGAVTPNKCSNAPFVASGAEILSGSTSTLRTTGLYIISLADPEGALIQFGTSITTGVTHIIARNTTRAAKNLTLQGPTMVAIFGAISVPANSTYAITVRMIASGSLSAVIEVHKLDFFQTFPLLS